MILLASDNNYLDTVGPTKRHFKLALTSGCFDLIHSGHVYFLLAMQKETTDAKQLVVIHDDQSIKNHKGKNRPILPVQERAVVLDAIQGVDYVLIWQGWENIVDLVKELRPDYLVTSQTKIANSNWDSSWANIADEIGAKLIGVKEIDHESSTTKLIDRIQKLT